MCFVSSISSLIPSNIRRLLQEARALHRWQKAGWPAPVPQKVKMDVLKRYSIPGMTWVETGTWMGDTTKALSGSARHVHSIEPQLDFVVAARERFRNLINVSLHHGTSEELFEEVVGSCSGDLAFWLDGHFSFGGTYEGEIDTPILSELQVVAENLSRFNSVSVFVDDFRCFDPSNAEFSDYPEKKVLVDWATENRLSWTVEHDIFVAFRVGN
jgi:hypothetical protein